MRENVPVPSKSRIRAVWSGATLVIVGLSFLLLAAEWFAMYDACVANPACELGIAPATIESYLALLVAGVALTVVGFVVVLLDSRRPLQRAMIVWV